MARRIIMKSVECLSAVLGYLPSPARAVVAADAGPVDTADESLAFKFDQTASQALWSVSDSGGFRYVGECFRGDGIRLVRENGEHVEFWSVHFIFCFPLDAGSMPRCLWLRLVR